VSGRLRVLVVDDERPAREKLRRLLSADADVLSITEASGGVQAVDAVRQASPDVMFLDVMMPDLDGFAVIGALALAELPHVVFVTASDQYAVRAFEVHAVDYLLKPFDATRLAAAVRRVKAALSAADAVRAAGRSAIHDASAVLRGNSLGWLERILVDEGERALLIDVDEVDWIESDRNYARVHARGRVFRVRTPLRALEERLDPQRLVRIGRSVIVAVDRITALTPLGHGDYDVQLRTGRRLVLSRRYRDRLNAFRI
jgi:two-component system, LytTR family, response regulator